MKLDVGGIAKGYASQAAIDVLRAQGITRALVAGAGDIVVGDPPPGAEGWTIGIAGLNPAVTEPETYVLLKNAAVSTSGDAERFVEIDGQRYSHIINPVTGLGVVDRASVTVVAPDGATADALETSVYILGPERGLKLVEETPGAAALYVRSTPGRHPDLRVVPVQGHPPDKTQGILGPASGWKGHRLSRCITSGQREAMQCKLYRSYGSSFLLNESISQFRNRSPRIAPTRKLAALDSAIIQRVLSWLASRPLMRKMFAKMHSEKPVATKPLKSAVPSRHQMR